MSKPTSLRPFLILLLGQGISLLGSSMTAFGLGVWVLEESGKVQDFALISLAASLPQALLSPLGGVIVDRWPRKMVLLIGQTGAVLISLTMAVLYWNQQLLVWHIIVLSAIAGSFNAVVLPAITASITMIVPKAKLSQANGLMATSIGIIQLLAPALAGVLIVVIELDGILMVDLVSFVAGIIALVWIAIPDPERTAEKEEEPGFVRQLSFGWHYITERRGLFWLLLFHAVITFSIASIGLLFRPMVLGFTDAQGLGLIVSASGLGMVMGGILVSIWGGPESKIKAILFASLLIGIGCVLTPIVPSVWAVAVGGMIIMAAFPLATTSNQTLFQRKVARDVQGRVSGFKRFVLGLMSPLAFLILGPLSDRVFEPMMAEGGSMVNTLGSLFGVGKGRGVALLVSALGCVTIFAVLLAYLNPRIRNLERELPDFDDVEEPSDREVVQAPV